MTSESMPATPAKSVEILAQTTSLKKEIKGAIAPHETIPASTQAIAPSTTPATQPVDGKAKKRQPTITLGEAVYALLQQSQGRQSEETIRLHQELAEVKGLIQSMDQRIQTQLALPEITARPILIQDLPDLDVSMFPYLTVLSHLETIVLDDELALDAGKAKEFAKTLSDYGKYLPSANQVEWRKDVESLTKPFSKYELKDQKVERYTRIQRMKWAILQHPPRH